MASECSGSLKKFKLVFLGEQSVGKTSIITRFMYDSFESTYQATIGIDFLSKSMFLEDKTIRLQLWDTAGQERFRSLIPSYIRDSSVAVVVYDISNIETLAFYYDESTFSQIDRWVQEVQSERKGNAVIILVGNKTDLTEKRCITDEVAAKKAEELGIFFMETSAKSGHNIKQLFKKIATELLSKEQPIPKPSDYIEVKLYDNQGETKPEGRRCWC